MKQNLKINSQKTGHTKQMIEHRCRGKQSSALAMSAVFCVLLALIVSGCATKGEIKRESTISAIEISDNNINVVVDTPFTYTVYKSSEDPYKVIVDMPNVRLGTFTDKIKSDRAGITEVTPYQTDEPLSTRLEILLTAPVTVEPMYQDTSLAIVVKEEPGPAITEAAVEAPKAEEPAREITSPEVAVSPEPAAEPVKEAAVAAPAIPEIKVAAARELSPATAIILVDVEKEQDTLKVVIKGDGALNPSVFRLDNRAVLDIPGVKLSATLPASVPSPLKNIRAGKHIDKLRLVLDMKEGTNFDVAAIEDSILVSFRIPEQERYIRPAEPAEKPAEPEVKTAVVEPVKSVEGKYKGQRISLDFQDADIGPIFRLLADISGYNFVIDPSVKGKITMKLMNVPWDQALDIILKTFALGMSFEGNIIWIAPTSMFAKMAEEKTKTKDIQEKAEDLMQEIVRVNYATAADVSKAISDGKLLSSRGSITIDSRMNTLIIKDIQKSIDKMKELVKIMDIAKPQVMIEAKIVEVSSDYSQSLGIKWGGSTTTQTWPTSGSADFSVNTPTDAAGAAETVSGGALGFSIGYANTLQVNLSLSALETVSKARKLSNPKVLTMDNEGASIQQGTSIPVQTTSAEGTKTEYVNATLKLDVTPKITPGGFVQLKINASNNALGALTSQGYAIEKKEVTTQALVKNGDTLVVGGIYTTDTIEGETAVPLLSKIPILGWLFKTKTQTGPNVKEMLIFITPTIVEQQI